MKRFVSAYQHIFSRKTVAILGIIALLGLIGGGSYIAQTQRPYVAAPTQVNSTARGQEIHFPRNRPKFVPKVRSIVHASAASSALRVVPTTVTTPAPTPISTTPPPAGQSPVATLIDQVFGQYATSALTVAKCESGLNPNAYNPISIGGSHAAGVFQILYPSTWDSTSQAGNSPYDALANIRAAYQIFSRDGYNWHEWSCAS